MELQDPKLLLPAVQSVGNEKYSFQLSAPNGAVSAQHEPHPYELVAVEGRHAILCSGSGAEFGTPLRVGQVLLALGVGIENEKTHGQIDCEIRSQEDARPFSDKYIGKLITWARQLTANIGPPIILRRGLHGVASTHYYEGIPPEQKAGDFEGWDDGLTRLRFYPQIGYLVVSHEGSRHGVRFDGWIQRTLLDYLFAHPGEEVSTDMLYKALVDKGYDGGKAGFGGNIEALRSHIERAFSIDSSTILQCNRVRHGGNRAGMGGFYKLQAHALEVMQTDSERQLGSHIAPIEERDVALVALGLLVKDRTLQRRLPLAWRQEWPAPPQLAQLVETVDTDDSRDVKSIVESDAVESLKRIKAFLAQTAARHNGSQQLLDDNNNALLAFLARLDKETIFVDRRPVSGLDAVLHFLKT